MKDNAQRMVDRMNRLSLYATPYGSQHRVIESEGWVITQRQQRDGTWRNMTITRATGR